MTWIMGDSITVADIPTSVAIAATYATGTYAAGVAEVQARFPHDKYGWNRIDTTGADPAHCDTRDWETGDKSGSLEQWVLDHNGAMPHRQPAVVYCNRSTIPEVRTLTGSQRLGIDYWLWVATLDGTVYNQPGTVACQVKDANLTGGHWDESLVFNGSFFLPIVSRPPVTLTEVDITARFSNGTTRAVKFP